jgi:hypothetical protein
MRPAHRASRPRHLAGTPKPVWDPQEHHLQEADFDVAAALDGGSEFDFDALFAGDYDAVQPVPPKVRPGRRKIAFAVSVTVAALPFLVLDNFTATAEAPDRESVAATADAAKAELDAVETTVADVTVADPTAATASSAATPSSTADVQVTLPAATRYDPGPTTTAAPPTTAAPTPTTAKPRPTTTTTAKATTTTTAAPKAPPTTVAKALAAPVGADPSSTATWDALARCESGGDWQAVSEPRNGVRYYGGLQFALSSWQGLGGSGLPSQASKATQIEMGKRLQARQGWAAWPTCARRLGWI